MRFFSRDVLSNWRWPSGAYGCTPLASVRPPTQFERVPLRVSAYFGAFASRAKWSRSRCRWLHALYLQEESNGIA
jgi:hypothetical protein